MSDFALDFGTPETGSVYLAFIPAKLDSSREFTCK